MYQSITKPLHVGIIMDGNGRWAEGRGMNRVSGHARGARRVSEIVRACPDVGVSHLTLYAFSTENWRRPLAEIDGLMRIFRQYICNKMDELRREDVRVRFIGMRHRVPDRLQTLMHALEEHTRECRRLNLTIAIDYGGRDEVTRAVKNIASRALVEGIDPETIGQDCVSGALDTAELPDPDFIIRTSGERRISNFLLWQAAYAEFEFPAKAWPEFTASDFGEAVASFHARSRRFGSIAPVSPAVAAES